MAGSAAQAGHYDFCLSFASEQRSYVEEVARLLGAAGLRVFYDSHETADLWGIDLYTHLDEIYNRGSRYCVLFASEAYARKMWTGHERMSAQDRALRSRAEYVLPVRFDDTEIPGLRGTVGYVDARTTSPAALVRLLLAKLKSGSSMATIPASILVLSADIRTDLGGIAREALARCRAAVPPGLITESATRTVVVVPESALPVVDVLAELMPEIERLARARQHLRLRISVHRGEVPVEHLDGCVDVTTAVEAALSAAVSEVFDRAPKARCAIVVTQRVYDTVVRPGRGGSNPSLYQLVTTADGTGLHVRVPGYPRLPGRTPPGAPPPMPSIGVVGKLNHFAGDTHAEQIGDRYYHGTGDDRH
ncbi:toll/interleukin-1 receptor domain-containing protein [Amycolatopsis sp. NPDC059027]|uniref:toll/interleukin-1 receptor domain-containing protein n=1 Tax=unclassified Amycolatopsis TaxID=2618356 RepID=UPI00366CC8F7